MLEQTSVTAAMTLIGIGIATYTLLVVIAVQRWQHKQHRKQATQQLKAVLRTGYKPRLRGREQDHFLDQLLAARNDLGLSAGDTERSKTLAAYIQGMDQHLGSLTRDERKEWQPYLRLVFKRVLVNLFTRGADDEDQDRAEHATFIEVKNKKMSKR